MVSSHQGVRAQTIPPVPGCHTPPLFLDVILLLCVHVVGLLGLKELFCSVIIPGHVNALGPFPSKLLLLSAEVMRNMNLLVVLSEQQGLLDSAQGQDRPDLGLNHLFLLASQTGSLEHHPSRHLFGEVDLALGHLAQHLVELGGVFQEGLQKNASKLFGISTLS